MELLFSFKGRINRTKWWLGSIFISLFMFGMNKLINLFGGGTLYDEPAVAVQVLQIFAIAIFVIYSQTALMVKRLHDRNLRGWIAAVFWLPLIFPSIPPPLKQFLKTGFDSEATPLFIGTTAVIGAIIMAIAIWLFVELGFLRGTPGSNKYGDEPLF